MNFAMNQNLQWVLCALGLESSGYLDSNSKLQWIQICGGFVLQWVHAAGVISLLWFTLFGTTLRSLQICKVLQ